MNMQLKVLVVEDDEFTRLMVCTALRSQNIDVALETSSASLALEQAESLRPDAAVLDLHLGKGPTGIDLAIALRKKLPSIGILILTSYEDPRLLNPNLPKIPSGGIYVTKKSIGRIEILTEAIQKAVARSGEKTLGDPLVSQATGSMSKLTNTQLETLRLMAQGLSNSEIAKRRFVTEKSVETSIARLAKSLGLASDGTRNQRVHMAKVYFRALGSNLEDQD
jgi:DNA-binding NarL/FixJ family response regulator